MSVLPISGFSTIDTEAAAARTRRCGPGLVVIRIAGMVTPRWRSSASTCRPFSSVRL